jgi:hypothetical protein
MSLVAGLAGVILPSNLVVVATNKPLLHTTIKIKGVK